MRWNLVFVPCLCLAVVGCDDENVSPYPSPEGLLSATLTSASGVEPVVIDAPPGNIYVQINDWGNRCEFKIKVYSDGRDTELFVTVKEHNIQELLAGESQDATAYAGFILVSDSVVRLEREREDGDEDKWYSVGGRIHVDALPAPGESMQIVFEQILLRGYQGPEDLSFDGTVTAVYRGAVTYDDAPSWEGTRACPWIVDLAE